MLATSLLPESNIQQAPLARKRTQSCGRRCCLGCLCCVILLLFLIVVPAVIFPVALSGLKHTWMQYLDAPPRAVLTTAANLTRRADDLARSLPRTFAHDDAVDVVISGGGSFDLYYLGAEMIFARAGIPRRRWAGASAGGMAPFELRLLGEQTTLTRHLSLGVLQSEQPLCFARGVPLLGAALAGYTDDVLYRQMARRITTKHAANLSRLDNVVHLALTCLTPLPSLVMVSNFTSASQAFAAFMGTGTFSQWYDGMLCSDGGAASGPKMTPLFTDGLRDQLIIDLMAFPDAATGNAVTTLERVSHYDVDVAVRRISRGMDEAMAFLVNGTSLSDGAITRCLRNATVDGGVCRGS